MIACPEKLFGGRQKKKGIHFKYVNAVKDMYAGATMYENNIR